MLTHVTLDGSFSLSDPQLLLIKMGVLIVNFQVARVKWHSF